MKNLLPFFFLLLTFGAFIMNVFALMHLIPLMFTLPLLFISIFLMFYSFLNRHIYRGWTR